MYTCETCSKEYKSQKTYLTHIERCDGGVQSRSRSRSRGSIDAVSDIESVRSRPRSASSVRIEGDGAGLLERLQRDRTKLKNEIKKYKQELRNRVEEHSIEMERSQEYLTEQIYALQEERDNLAEQVSSSRDELFQEKERLRTEFAQKIRDEKNRLQMRYGDQNSSQVARLGSSLDKVQTRLTEQIDEKDRLRIECEKALADKDEYYHKKIEELNDKLVYTQRSIDSEREEIRRNTVQLAQDKETLRVTLQKEYEAKLVNLQKEKHADMEALQHKCNELSKQLGKLTEESKAIHESTVNAYNTQLYARDKTIAQLKDTHARNIDYLEQQSQGQLQNTTRRHELEIERLKHEHENALIKLETLNDQSLTNLRAECSLTVQKSNDEIRTVKQQLFDVEKKTEDKIRKNDSLLEEQLAKINRAHQEEIATIKEDARNELLQAVNERDETIAEVEKVNYSLGSQLGQYKTAMENMEGDMSHIKSQFLTTLNKKQCEDNKVIQEREGRIKVLEKDLEQMTNECNKKLADARIAMERLQVDMEHARKELKLKDDSLNELKQSCERLNNERASITKQYEERINSIKKDYLAKMNMVDQALRKEMDQKYSVIIEKNREDLRSLRNENEVLLIKLKEQDSYQLSRMSQLEKDLKRSQADLSETEKYQQMYINLEVLHRSFSSASQKKMAELTIQVNDLTHQLEDKQQKLGEMEKILKQNTVQVQVELNKAVETRQALNVAQRKVEELTKENERLTEQVQNPPRNKNIEDKLRKMRDDCLRTIQENKAQLKTLTEENNKLKHEMNILEALSKEKDEKVKLVGKSENKIREEYLQKMNDQMAMYEEKLKERDRQIEEANRMAYNRDQLLKEDFLKKMNEQRTVYEGKLHEMKDRIDRMTDEAERNIEKLRESIARDYKEEIATYRQNIAVAEERILLKEQDLKADFEKRIAELCKQHEGVIHKYQQKLSATELKIVKFKDEYVTNLNEQDNRYKEILSEKNKEKDILCQQMQGEINRAHNELEHEKSRFVLVLKDLKLEMQKSHDEAERVKEKLENRVEHLEKLLYQPAAK